MRRTARSKAACSCGFRFGQSAVHGCMRRRFLPMVVPPWLCMAVACMICMSCMATLAFGTVPAVPCTVLTPHARRHTVGACALEVHHSHVPTPTTHTPTTYNHKLQPHAGTTTPSNSSHKPLDLAPTAPQARGTELWLARLVQNGRGEDSCTLRAHPPFPIAACPSPRRWQR
jgi:hypothetical protein